MEWCQSTFGKDPQLEHQGWLGKFCPFWLQDRHPTETPHNWIEVAPPDLGSTSQEMGPKKPEMKLGWETVFLPGALGKSNPIRSMSLDFGIRSISVDFGGPQYGTQHIAVMARRCTNGLAAARKTQLPQEIHQHEEDQDLKSSRARGYLARP